MSSSPSSSHSETSEQNSDFEQSVQLDLSKMMTWTGNAVTLQPGAEFKMPILVPFPSILAFQFEVENGDLSFSLIFNDDQDNKDQLLVEPQKLTDREAQLDIDTTGTCTLIWSNAHAWMSTKTLSYQLQLAPKVDTLPRRAFECIVTAATEYRMQAAVDMSERLDEEVNSIEERTAGLQTSLSSAREEASVAETKLERYQKHVRRLKEEVEAAEAHVATAAAEFKDARSVVRAKECAIVALQRARQLDYELSADVDEILDACHQPLLDLFFSYAGSLYEPEGELEGEEDIISPKPAEAIDRAEMLHMFQDFKLLGRGDAPYMFCGVFLGCPQTLNVAQFKRCIARAALALAPTSDEARHTTNDDSSSVDKLLWLLRDMVGRIQELKLPVLEIKRRVVVFQALERLGSILAGR